MLQKILAKRRINSKCVQLDTKKQEKSELLLENVNPADVIQQNKVAAPAPAVERVLLETSSKLTEIVQQSNDKSEEKGEKTTI